MTLNVATIQAKIRLRQPLTPREYAFAVLYLNLDPKAYTFKEEKEQTETKPKLPKTKNKQIRRK